MAASRPFDFVVIALYAVALVGIMATYLYFFRYLIQYSVESGVLKIKLFGVVTVRRIRVSDIESASVVDWKQMIPFSGSFNSELLFSERWGGYNIGKGSGS